MDKRMLTPKEIALTICETGTAKAKLSIPQMLVLGIFGGAFIALGAQGAIAGAQTLGNIDVGLQKLVFAMLFPVGLMLVVICGAELFTGNNLMSLGCLNSHYPWKYIIKNWFFVYTANFVGAVGIALLVAGSGLMEPGSPAAAYSIALAQKKAALAFGPALIRGILCNMVVVLSVWMAAAAKDVTGKIFSCWFPIIIFVVAGYEHSVANMFFIPLGMFLGADITWSGFLINNLVPVTIGNIIGGSIIVPLFYYVAYIKGQKA